MYNPSLREQPLDQPAAVIPQKHESSILDWLESTGRLLARDESNPAAVYDEADEEISDLMGADDVGFDDDDDFDDDAAVDDD
ncbi:MAG TPA: hypothetical protein DCY88_34875 [Cyanobacteria bacterium UBA11372]|nr:hypothetical protein [Cyanobacteria bacterium UBA11372]